MTEPRIKWERQRSIVHNFGSAALQNPANSYRDMHADHEDNYVRLALARYADFVGQLAARSTAAAFSTIQERDAQETAERQRLADRMAESPSTKQGFLACGYLLGLGIAAYKQKWATVHDEPSTEGLAAILLHPRTVANTVTFLTTMPNDQNKIWEVWLGLRNSVYATSQHQNHSPFVFAHDEQGNPYMGIDQQIRIGAVRDVLIAGAIRPDAPEHESCPAQRFIPNIWESMVREAAEDPGLFTADLAVQPVQ